MADASKKKRSQNNASISVHFAIHVLYSLPSFIHGNTADVSRKWVISIIADIALNYGMFVHVLGWISIDLNIKDDLDISGIPGFCWFKKYKI